ncbi:MAG: hypothetical protein ACRDZX_06990 [Acidimicrobiales bacterium]
MTGVKLYVLLADRGTQNPHNGTLSLLNVGWAVTQLRRLHGPGAPPGIAPLVTGPQVVVVFIEAELAMCNRALLLQIELLTEDGNVVGIPGPPGQQAVRLEQAIMVPSPPGLPTGFPGRATAMMELPTGLPLAPGSYRWQARVNGKEEDDWSAHLYVAAPPQPPAFGFSAPQQEAQ